MKRLFVTLCALLIGAGAARAEVNEIRFAQQFSMGYLQFNMMAHRKLLESTRRCSGSPN